MTIKFLFFCFTEDHGEVYTEMQFTVPFSEDNTPKEPGNSQILRFHCHLAEVLLVMLYIIVSNISIVSSNSSLERRCQFHIII